MTLRWLTILALVVGLLECCTHPQKQATWVRGNIESGPKRMSQTEVVAVAQASAPEHGFSLSDYQPPSVSFNQPERLWNLWFWEKPPGHPGGFLLIEVDDKTGQVEFLPGR